MTHRALTTLTLTLAVALAGCGITDPYRPSRRPAVTTGSTTRSTSTTSAAADSSDPVPERGGTIPAAAQAAQHTLAAGAAAPTSRAAVERYARLYLNWTAAGLVARERRLAALSVGQARAQALQAAASAARDPELTRGHVTNTGQLIARTPGVGVAAGRWVLVSRETTTGTGDYAGLPASLHVIYAQVTHTPAGWVITQWSPQT